MSGGALAGRGAVVTGAGRGIGAAVARALAEAGAAVVRAARTREDVEHVAGELSARGLRAFAIACDVTREPDVKTLGTESQRVLGTVDILVNNAGTSAAAKLENITLDDWNAMLAGNLTGTFLCTREWLPGMTSRGWGRVVNIASIAGLEGARLISHYAAAKHAVVGFTRAVAAEVAGTGVTVNAVCPGYADTPMTERTLANVQARTGMPPDRALAAVLASSGQDRLVSPAEIAAQVVKLCLESAAGITGETLVLGLGARTR